ncbi:transposable element Tcb1 transposase [Trichonephila clavipes]|nr:transposable element Tcb1 transposase [Trichonephila clavipes]
MTGLVIRKVLMDRALMDVTSPESRMGDVCKTTSVCMNRLITFAIAWTLNSETMATLDAASQTGVSSQCFCLQHQDGHIRVRWHHGEHILAANISRHHTSSSPGMVVWDAVGYASRSSLVRIYGTFNSIRYISGVLRPMALTFIRVLRKPTFMQDNVRPYVIGIVRTFLKMESVRLLPWPARSPDLSPIENS